MWLPAAGLLAVLLSSCGGGGRPGPSPAARALAEARELLSKAEAAEGEKRYAEAIRMYEYVRDEKLAEARKHARKGDLEELQRIGSRVEAKLVELARKQSEEQARLEKERLEKEKAAVGLPKVDLAEELRKKQEAERKQVEAAKKELARLPTEIPRKKETDVEAEQPGKAPGVSATAKTETVERTAGPFLKYGPDHPPVTVDKIVSKGGAAFAYIQVFNDDQANNRRIARAMVTFRDAQNRDLMEADAVFEYETFDPNAKDLLSQPDPRCILTGESHEVVAASSLKLVAVISNSGKAAQAQKASVKVLFQDDREVSGSGPAATAGSPRPPGL